MPCGARGSGSRRALWGVLLRRLLLRRAARRGLPHHTAAHSSPPAPPPPLPNPQVTRERVRQIEAKALRALRSNLGTMEASIGEYSDASFGGERLAARTSSGTKKT